MSQRHSVSDRQRRTTRAQDAQTGVRCVRTLSDGCAWCNDRTRRDPDRRLARDALRREPCMGREGADVGRQSPGAVDDLRGGRRRQFKRALAAGAKETTQVILCGSNVLQQSSVLGAIRLRPLGTSCSLRDGSSAARGVSRLVRSMRPEHVDIVHYASSSDGDRLGALQILPIDRTDHHEMIEHRRGWAERPQN